MAVDENVDLDWLRPPKLKKEAGRDDWWFRSPQYIIDVFAKHIGPTAGMLYMALCRHADGDRVCYPGYKLLAVELGIHPGRVKKQMKRLLYYGLVKIEERSDKGRRTSNRYLLIDPVVNPTTIPAYVEPRRAGALAPSPTGAQAPQQTEALALPPTGARATPPPERARPGIPELDPRELDPKGGGTAPSEKIDSESPADELHHLVDVWMYNVSCASPQLQRDHRKEITVELAELLRRGYTALHLEAAIRDPDRDRTEWPRLFRARIVRSKPANLTQEEREAKVKAQREVFEREAREAQKVAQQTAEWKKLRQQLAKRTELPPEN